MVKSFKIFLMSLILFTQDISLSIARVDLATAPKLNLDKGAVCYPFVQRFKKRERIGNGGRNKTVPDFVRTFENIHEFTGNTNACRLNGVCFCSDKVIGDSKYKLPLKCEADEEINTFSKCSIDPSSNSWEQVVNGCDGKCYRLSDEDTFVDYLYNYLKGLNDNTEVYSKSELEDMADDDQGICLPEFTCKLEKIGANGILGTGDECEDDLEVKQTGNLRRCVDPEMNNISVVPDEIKFKLNKDSCDIFAYEVYNSSPTSSSSTSNNSTSSGILESTNGTAWQGSPVVSVLQNSASKFSNANGSFDYENYKYISPTDFKFRFFELILNNMEYLWGEAESAGAKKGTASLPSPIHKQFLGEQATTMFKKYGVGRKFLNLLQEIESRRIYTLNGIEVDPELEPLKDLKAKIYLLEKFRQLIDLDLIILDDLIGGQSVYDRWSSDYDDVIYGIVVGTDFPPASSEDRNTIAYLRHSNDTIAQDDLKLWHYSEGSDCGAGDEIPTKTNGDYKRECEDGPPMQKDHWLTLRNAVQESIVIGTFLNGNGTAYKGSLVNAFYPRELNPIRTVNLTGHSWRHSWGEGYKIDNFDLLKETYASGVLDYFNQQMPDFDGTSLGDTILTSSSYAENLFNRFLALRPGYFDLPTSYDEVIGFKSTPCAVGNNLVNKRNLLSPEDYFTLKKLKGLLTQSENQKVPQAGVIHRDLIKKLKESKVADQTLNEFFQKNSTETMMEIFINMHFSIFASKYDFNGTSRLNSNTGRWKKPRRKRRRNYAGRPLGYIEELNAMVEYVIKYKEGMKDGLNEQIICLKDRLQKDEDALQEANTSDTVETTGSVDSETQQSSQTPPPVFFDDRILEIKSACDVVPPAESEQEAATTSAISSNLNRSKGVLGLNVGEGVGESKLKESKRGIGKGTKGNVLSLTKNNRAKINSISFRSLNDPKSIFSSSRTSNISESSSTSSSSAATVTSSGGPKRAKIASKKDDIKKLISDINADRGKKIKEHNDQEVKTQSLVTIDDIFNETVISPQSTRLQNETKLASLGDVKIKKEAKQTAAISEDTKNKKKKRLTKRVKRKKRKKKRAKNRERRKLSPNHSRMLQAVRTNRSKYMTSDKDSIFTRISKAIVREGYPIIFGDPDKAGSLPSNSGTYRSSEKERFLD